MGVKANLIGQKFGKLSVIEETSQRKDKSIVWKCLCDCGNFHLINTKKLRAGTKSCGCLLGKCNFNSKYVGEDLTGQIFGKLKVIGFHQSDKFQNRRWNCLCDCGNNSYVTTAMLKGGKSKSCGCFGYKSGNRKGSDIYNYSGYEDITGTKWNSIKTGALKRNLIFDITKEQVWKLFIEQNRKCKLSGVDICYILGTASIDRINSSVGYTIENIQLVHKDINRMKSDFKEDYFIELCKCVNNNQKTI